MKKLVFCAFILSSVMLIPLSGQTTWTVDDDLVQCPAANFKHPQDAVNAASPGDTIIVYPGTYGSRDRGDPYTGSDRYAPALIVYKVGLTIKAANPDRSLTIIQSTHLYWSSISAVVWSTNGGVVPTEGISPSGIEIIANNVTIEGFTVRAYEGNINTAAILVGALYAGETRYGISGTIVKNCDLSGNAGIRIWNAPYTTIEHSLIKNMLTGTSPAAVVIHDGDSTAKPYPTYSGSANVSILNNEIFDIHNYSAIELGGVRSGSYVDHSGLRIEGNIIHTSNGHGVRSYGGSNVDNAKIIGNIISPATTVTGPAAGINIGAAPPAAKRYSSITIKDNKISGLINALNLGYIINSTIDHNEFQDCRDWGTNIYNYSNAVTVTNNIFINNGKWTKVTVLGGGLCANNSTGVVAHCNQFLGNMWGVYSNGAAYQIDATNNWWGDSTGPYHATLNPSAKGDPITDYVSFNPWLSPSLGFDNLSLAFGDVVPGSESLVQYLRISNAADSCAISKLEITGINISTSDFTIVSGGTPPNIVIDPDGSVLLGIKFNPTSIGAKTATLSVVSNDPDNLPTVTLTGTGVPVIAASSGANGSVAPTGNVPVALNGDKSITITAETGYHIDTVKVDATQVATNPPSPYTYTFTSVTANHTIEATFAANSYNVAFDSQGGSAGTSQSVVYNTLVTKPTPDPTKAGYTFAGWYKDAGGTIAWNFASDKMGAADMTLYAKWTVNKYSVTFNPQGGSAVASESVAYDSLVTKPANPTKIGYTFDGWYKEAACANAWNFATDKMGAADMTLYAKWKIITFTVTASAGPGGSIAPLSKVVDYGSSLTLTITPAKGYAVDDISDTTGGVTTVITDPKLPFALTNITADHTIKVTFAALMRKLDIERVKIDFSNKPVEDRIYLKGSLDLGKRSNKVKPGDPVTLTIDDKFSQTITMTAKWNGRVWEYRAPRGADGIIEMTIEWQGTRANFEIHIDDVEIGTAKEWRNPVQITLQIGDDIGTDSVRLNTHKDYWDCWFGRHW